MHLSAVPQAVGSKLHHTNSWGFEINKEIVLFFTAFKALTFLSSQIRMIKHIYLYLMNCKFKHAKPIISFACCHPCLLGLTGKPLEKLQSFDGYVENSNCYFLLVQCRMT